ncbi:MAG: transcription antitermination factor NusB [Bacteroidetes bacterium]|nr:transcription antitermination factor NusB [Bacteroidota bacterium]MCL2302615.1 transcription antitermination factor NusB [Lentimicrobiaceae bacterium]
MVTRRYLRIKVLQALYAVEKNPKEDFLTSEKKLDQAIQNCQILSVYFLTLLPEIVHYRTLRLEELKEKNNPTAEDLNPNTKFIDNEVIKQIEENKSIQQFCVNHYVDWSDRYDFIAQMYHEIANSELFIAYFTTPERSYKEDKEFVLNVLSKLFAESELLHWFLEEKNVHWFDDYNDALLTAYKNIERFKENQSNQLTLIPLFKDEDEVTFYKDLFRKTLLHNADYQKRIDEKLQHWESERVMDIDTILMKMAMCELTQFPTIPVKVTINEYIELAKLYSSRKSGVFINGILDNIITDLKNEGLLNKMGRGLIN